MFSASFNHHLNKNLSDIIIKGTDYRILEFRLEGERVLTHSIFVPGQFFNHEPLADLDNLNMRTQISVIEFDYGIIN